MKEKKLIIGVTAVIVLIIAIIAIVSLTGKDKEGKEDGTTNAVVNDGETTTNFWDNVQIFEGDGDTPTETKENDGAGSVVETETDSDGNIVTKKADNKSETTTKKTNKKGDKGNNNQGNQGNENNNSTDKSSSDDPAIDDFVIFEDGGNQEEPTDKNGETVSEEYPGQADGWSPLVSPDDLKK